MNYVILNGVKSTTIKGLLIQSLPPISKPLMRTQIEEIDGKDGDIVTNLGYSAYDKEITIGLFGDYDVDEVISYFNGSGTVIFSNEHDKYYYYQIINQIDYERLIRFKTATVTFHVQPFKYSSVEKPLDFTIDSLIKFDDFTQTKNGLTLTAENGVISVSGTSTSATEFYLPIDSVNLKAGLYTLNATATGTGVSSANIRLIDGVPSDAKSFGGTYINLQNGESVTLNANLETEQTYNYLWFYINANTLNFEVDIELIDNNIPSVTVTNTGNTTAKPTITIYGNGNIALSLNGQQIFNIALGSQEYITIDVAQMEAYKDGILKNRLVTGDYDNFIFKVGRNVISWSGSVSEIVIANYSRWI